MLSETEIEIVRRYADLDLSEEELKSFEARINSEQAYKLKVEKYLGVRNEIIEEFVAEEPKALAYSKPSKRPLLIGAFMLLFITAISLFFFLQKKSTPSLIASCEEYVEIISMNDLRSTDPKSQEQMNSFDIRIQKLIQLKEENEWNILGSEIEKMRTDFSATEDQEILEWWNVLSHLKKGQDQKAKEALIKISKNELYNSHTKAEQLLN